MNAKRKIEKIGGKVLFADQSDADVQYWADLSIKNRLEQAFEWNKIVWQHLLKGQYPEKIELIGGKKNKDLTDEDDF